MQSCRSTTALVAALVASGTLSCGPKRVSEPTRPDEVLIVLLPDADTGTTGRVRIFNPLGAVELIAERAAVRAASKRAPEAVPPLTEADVKRLFGGALAAMPPPLRQFTLYFRFESDELTDESRALLRDVLTTVKQTAVPEVVVIGHTDTMGRPTANFRLGLRRAASVRDLLVKAGLLTSAIEVTSHGEADLLVKTADETPEPRNRRVEIAVR